MKYLYTFIVLAVIFLGGYYGYVYLKENPPEFLIKLATKTEAPPPLPEGKEAPLQTTDGFVTTIFSRDTPGARVLTSDQDKNLLVSLTKEGKIVALPDKDNNEEADSIKVIVEGLDRPHGILVRCESEQETLGTDCTLFVAETGSLTSYAYNAETFSVSNKQRLLEFPSDGGHFTRTLLMHPNDVELLISVGSSCNVCTESDPRRATVLSYNLKTKVQTIFASGLRNSVFLAIDPITKAVWATENGRDVVGNNIPPDEINIIEFGKHYGWPDCYGKNVFDSDFSDAKEPRICESATPSHIDLQAHSAALGLAFIPEEGWPDYMAGDVLVAYHGSWNRDVPTGYKVVRIELSKEKDRNAESEAIDFLTGFQADGQKTGDALGRPVGLLVEPDGVVYVSDDRAGAVYKVSRK